MEGTVRGWLDHARRCSCSKLGEISDSFEVFLAIEFVQQSCALVDPSGTVLSREVLDDSLLRVRSAPSRFPRLAPLALHLESLLEDAVLEHEAWLSEHSREVTKALAVLGRLAHERVASPEEAEAARTALSHCAGPTRGLLGLGALGRDLLERASRVELEPTRSAFLVRTREHMGSRLDRTPLEDALRATGFTGTSFVLTGGPSGSFALTHWAAGAQECVDVSGEVPEVIETLKCLVLDGVSTAQALETARALS
jgi:hypothetical protein